MISNHVTILKTLKTAYQIIYMLRPIPIKDLRLIYFWSKYDDIYIKYKTEDHLQIVIITLH